jgi:uncharacterized membrane protein YheB (UPF0754 family)
VVSIPLVAAVVTWVHVWLAMKMVFYPLEFVGIVSPWLGWQGIVPRKAAKMAAIVVENTLGKVASLREIFRDLEPAAIARQIRQELSCHVEEFVDEVMNEKNRGLWEKVPKAMKEPFYQHVRQQLPEVLDGLMKDVDEHIEELIDLRSMIVRRLGQDKALMVQTFQEVGDREIAFVVNSSFWIGMFFGAVQMVMWFFWPFHWGLPLYGAALGYLTNWVALNMVFRPLDPVTIGPFRFQGVFLRRQTEVAEKFAALATREMLTVKHIMTEIMTGERSERTRELMVRRLTPLLEGGVVGPAIQMVFGPQGHADLQRTVVEKAARKSLEPLDDPAFIADRARVMASIFSARLTAMRPAEFQDVLRPAFHEDEWILIALGAIFGFLAGWGQMVVGFR